MSDDIQMTMLKTIVTSQESLKQEVTAIKESMIEIVRIEERQSNMTEGMNRIGRSIDKAELRIGALTDELAILRSGEISILKARLDTMAVKVAAVASVAATGITGVVLYAFEKMTSGG